MMDQQFLMWIHERLLHVHKESELMDYMHKLRAIIANMSPTKTTPNVGTCDNTMTKTEDAQTVAAVGSPFERTVRPSLFARMEDGHYAEEEAMTALENILGVELLGIDFDVYDSSFELYPMSDVMPTPEQHASIMALGCSCYWINFEDGTESYCGGERKTVSGDSRWDRFNLGNVQSRALALLREALDQLLDDMGPDGHCVCEDAKQQALDAIAGPSVL